MGNWIAMMIVVTGRLRRGDELDDWGKDVVDAPRRVHLNGASVDGAADSAGASVSVLAPSSPPHATPNRTATLSRAIPLN